MNVIVTGAAGFIGGRLLQTLAGGYHVKAIVHKLPDANRVSARNLVEIVCGDVADAETWTRAGDADAIIALACSPRSISLDNPLQDLDVNCKATALGLEHARKKRACFIFASNAGIASNPHTLPVDETFNDTPITPYDVHKLASEHLMSVYSSLHGVRTLTFRLASTYGPGQQCRKEARWHPIIPHFFRLMRDGNTPTIDGDGEQTRDFVFVDDVVRALLSGLQKLTLEDEAKEITGQMMILGTSSSVSVNRVYESIADYLHYSLGARHGPAKPWDVRRMQYSYAKAASLLDWRPSVTFEKGLALTLDWLRQATNDATHH